ncbi:MAG: hypothetical protein JEZ07_12310 [Phycisphaerae bacterium]|nr:hypothetical protein [Phycisphaerae bacterium]
MKIDKTQLVISSAIVVAAILFFYALTNESHRNRKTAAIFADIINSGGNGDYIGSFRSKSNEVIVFAFPDKNNLQKVIMYQRDILMDGCSGTGSILMSIDDHNGDEAYNLDGLQIEVYARFYEVIKDVYPIKANAAKPIKITYELHREDGSDTYKEEMLIQ